MFTKMQVPTGRGTIQFVLSQILDVGTRDLQ